MLPQTQALVSFTDVQKTYDGESLVVRDLNLNIQRGEFLSLLGPSGSGKTTTLMMLAGFESPTSGDIYLNGVTITRTPPHKRNFGMVFQNYALFPHMTVAENVAYPLSVRNFSRSERETKVARVLDMVKLVNMGARYPSQLSGGQQQRVALARALVFDPQLILMDEPLGALDKQLREHMQIELKALHRRLGVTFVYVTHVDNLYETPANRFVAGFVGDSTVLNARVTALDDLYCEVQLTDGTLLRGTNVNNADVGETVQCGIRPERLQIAHSNMPALPNSLQASVADIMYFGDHLRLRCLLRDQPDAMVKMPLAHHLLPEIGQRIAVHAPEEHLRVYR